MSCDPQWYLAMNELRHSMRINHVLFQPQTRCTHMCLPLLEVEVLAGEENMGKQSSHGEEYTFVYVYNSQLGTKFG